MGGVCVYVSEGWGLGGRLCLRAEDHFQVEEGQREDREKRAVEFEGNRISLSGIKCQVNWVSVFLFLFRRLELIFK